MKILTLCALALVAGILGAPQNSAAHIGLKPR